MYPARLATSRARTSCTVLGPTMPTAPVPSAYTATPGMAMTRAPQRSTQRPANGRANGAMMVGMLKAVRVFDCDQPKSLDMGSTMNVTVVPRATGLRIMASTQATAAFHAAAG